ncbi:trypsin-like peptidase domain-containing protein [Herbaspirillum sp. SJZ107]|uniref:trypsin-like peptidase domain-containing protein n=1 Tax=Herbaspirillum sp. SJZ107 TaxID=2572881 RepID=UPI00114F8CB0|nr:trypsin-like peptidase domain-containing protein [Herbaspirillum sp. SJZ107]TQK03493.1 WD40 repeat protein [Herbaspirillum sp. SJZ107]
MNIAFVERALAWGRILLRIAVLIGMVSASVSARAQLLPSQAAGPARSQVVMLQVNRTFGAGVIVGSDTDYIYVATAAHISDLTKRPRPQARVKFDDASDIWRSGEFMEPFEEEERGDLAVVIVKMDDGLRNFLNGLDFAMLSPVPLPPSDSPVTSIGYSGGSPWTRGRNETLLPTERETLRITSDVLEGQSGGAVYNEAWELIGMTMYRDVAGPIVYARPISSVLRSLQGWGVPVRLTSRPEAARVKGADEIARENEQRAQRAVRRNLAARLASQSDQVRQSSPIRAMLLAAEALRATQQDGIVTNVAREAIAKSLGGVGGVGLNGHSETVFSATFNSDDTLLATASRDGAIRVWDIANPRAPKCIKILMEPGQSDHLVSHHMTFDKQSAALITLAQSGGLLAEKERLSSPKIWSLDTPEISPAPRWLINDHAASKAMATSHKRDYIAVATVSNRVILYSTAQKQGKVQRTLSIPPGFDIRHLVFSRDDSVLLGGTDNARVVIWNLRTGDGAPSAAFDTGHVNQMPFEDDSRPTIDLLDISDDHVLLVTGSSHWRLEGRFGDPSLRIWRLDGLAPTGAPWVVDQAGNEVNKFVLDAFFYEKSHLVVGVTPGGSHNVWDPARGRFDGIMGSDIPSSRLQGGEHLQEAIHSRNREVLTLSRGRSVDVLRTGSLKGGKMDQMIHFSGLDGYVDVIALSDSARFLFAGSSDGGARLWDLKRADPLGQPSSLDVNPYSNAIALGLSDSGHIAITLRGASLEFWNIQDLEKPRLLYAQEIDLERFGDCIVCSLVLSPDERWVAIQDKEKDRSLVIEIVPGSGTPKRFLVASRTWTNTKEIVFSPDSRFLFVDEANNVTVVYDLHAQSPTRAVVLDSGSYASPIFSSDGKWVLFRRFVNEYHDPIGRERVVGFLAPTNAVRDARQRLPISGFATSIGEAAFSPDGRWLALSGKMSFPERQRDDRRVQVLHLVGDRWTKHADLEPIEYAAQLLRFSPDGRWLFTGSDDVMIGDRNVSAKIWDLKDTLIAVSPQTLPNTIWNLKLAKFSPDSNWLVTVSGANSYADLWTIRNNKWEFVSRLAGPLPRLNNHWAAVFGPDSKTVVLWTTDDATPFYWRLETQHIVESGKAIPNGDRGVDQVHISSNGQVLTILNSGGLPTETAGTVGSYVTYVDLVTFPAEDSYATVPASSNANSHVYREDLGVVVTAGKSLVVSVVDMGSAMRRSAEVVGRNMSWDEWVKARIASQYRPTYPTVGIGADVIVNVTKDFERLDKDGRGTEADGLKRDLLIWARQLGDAKASNSLAWALATAGDPSVALDIVACSLRLAPDNPDYHDTRGVALVLLNRNEEAIAEFEYFVEHAQGIERFANMIQVRRQWLQRLRAGQEPFLSD